MSPDEAAHRQQRGCRPPEDFRETAETLGQALLKMAARAKDGSVYWRGPAERAGQLVWTPLPTTMFAGSLGVALFLAGLARVTGDAAYGELSRETLRPLQREVEQLVTDTERAARVQLDLGGLSGLGSMIYGLVRAGDLLDEPSFHETAHQISGLVTAERIANDEALDVMLGCAGTLLALLALHERRPSANAQGRTPLELAILCGQRLLDRRVDVAEGFRAWAHAGASPMGGFCHGTAGIEYALLRLHASTGTPAFLTAAVEAMENERRLFDAARRDWSYLHAEEPRFLNSWCKGAPGLLIARCGGLTVFDTAEVRAELPLAIARTASAELSLVDDVCCGNFGRVDALLFAGARLSDPGTQAAAHQLASEALDRAEGRRGFVFASKFQGALDPRFFPGISGVGYTLLRLAAPEALPSILALE
ncbi:Lanthionine biosynthesis protein LanM [Myxococcus hansupus]|uniref:Lanthionine biosynthesis protein LanM n=1 Tax=Pseudomyxococcus hansupus TaxID=1297742 RepID=A0A0H4WX56_9BACT|nr:lanthionine synthetase LanC family protein [Myxococcus hansupus]AKQ65935.1 Lanthionine biosynthesis protein LanM [Myxococcus hansupus]